MRLDLRGLRSISIGSILLAFLIACAQTSATIEDPVLATPPDDLPHIVLIMADDLGNDIGPCTNSLNLMPKLDAKCRDALVFERAYSYPYCTASRAALMTGRHMFRHGANDVQTEVAKLPLSEVTLAESISAANLGYRTAAFGKWHLTGGKIGENVDDPNRQGFDHFEGHPRQHGSYDFAANSYDWYINGRNTGRVDKYKATQITDVVIADFKNHQTEPQFYFVNYVLPHFPYHVPPAHLHSYDLAPPPESMNQGNLRRNPAADPYLFAMLEALDNELARLTQSLEAHATRPVLFIFLGDNGTANDVYQGDLSGGWYRGKASLFQGGVRVPLMLWSSPRSELDIQAGRTDILVNTFDLFPTLLELMGAGPQSNDIDALSFVSVLADHTYETREMLYLESGHDRRLAYNFSAIDQRGMKLIVQEPERRRDRIEFLDLMAYYDTRTDPGEAANLMTDAPCTIDYDNLYGLLDFMYEVRRDATQNTKRRFDYNLYLSTIQKLQADCRERPN